MCRQRTEESERSENRKQNMVKENAKRVALKEKMCQEITVTSDELQDELLKIDLENISASSCFEDKSSDQKKF